MSLKMELLFPAFLEAVSASKLLGKAVKPTGCIKKSLFTGVKRVTSRADVNLDQWIFVAVFPFDGVFGFNGRSGQERKIGRHVLEDHGTITGMNTFFHGSQPSYLKHACRAKKPPNGPSSARENSISSRAGDAKFSLNRYSRSTCDYFIEHHSRAFFQFLCIFGRIPRGSEAILAYDRQ